MTDLCRAMLLGLVWSVYFLHKRHSGFMNLGLKYLCLVSLRLGAVFPPQVVVDLCRAM